MRVASGPPAMGTVLVDLVKGLKDITAVAVVGFDGMVIDQCTSEPDVNLDLISVGHTSLIKQAVTFLRDSNGGEPTELILTTSRQKLVARLVAKEYFLLIILRPEASLGQARHVACRAGSLLEAELR
ncbi:MAG: hypothetical protein O7F16_02430 [Acidobacteria bacterium]|nr:hypothetical protein [Acidobacteriota bacterium]